MKRWTVENYSFLWEHYRYICYHKHAKISVILILIYLRELYWFKKWSSRTKQNF